MIKKYRKQIDKLDSQIISLLKKRQTLAKKVREEKIKEKLPLKDKKREQQVLKKAGKFKKIFKEVLK